MNKAQINDWIKNFVNEWKNHNVAAILDMFGEVEFYYEGPFSEPVSSREDVEKLWVDTEYQDIHALSVDLISFDSSVAAMHWYLKYKDTRDSVVYEMDGVYQVAFNENNMCNYFKQWWVINE